MRDIDASYESNFPRGRSRVRLSRYHVHVQGKSVVQNNSKGACTVPVCYVACVETREETVFIHYFQLPYGVVLILQNLPVQFEVPVF